MRATSPAGPGKARIVSIDEVAIKGGFSDVGWDHDSWTYGHPRPCLPDLADPCTLGGLLSLVRLEWGKSGLCLTTYRLKGPNSPLRWGWDGLDEYHETEAEALVAALECAP